MTFLARLGGAARRRLLPPFRRDGTTSADTIDFDAPWVANDPFPHFERLRTGGVVQFLPKHQFWIVLGYNEAKAVLGDADSFSNATYADVDAVLLAADPPDQPIVRRFVTRSFTPQALDRLTATAGRATAARLRSELDGVKDIAAPVSRAVAADLIGFDDNAVADILQAREQALAAQVPLAALTVALDEIAPRATLYRKFLDDPNGLSDDRQVRSLIRLLWLAATTTTERVIGHSLLRLAQYPAIAGSIRADRDLIAPFIEEVMRLHPPEHMLPRVANRATVLAGTPLPAGAIVQVCVAAANRDPMHFDAPAELRFDRPPKRHLTFGSGIHHCLGAPLSRRVIAAVLGTVLDASPNLRLGKPPSEIAFFKTANALSPIELPISL